MPLSYFERWVMYEQEEPFGQPWENWLMAVPAHQFAHVNSKRPPNFKDFYFKGRAAREAEEKSRVDNFFEFLEGRANGS